MAAPKREILLDNGDAKQELAQCHLMPCKIEHNHLEIRAKEYFWPTIRELDCDDVDMIAGRNGEVDQGPSKGGSKNTGDKKMLTASFRGRPLQGRVITLPEGYKGVAVTRDGKINKKFDSFTYWNWDQMPRDDDKVVKAISWFKISEALSS